jgi:hypothetical protein
VDLPALLPTAKTVANNVHQLAEDYRHALKPILISQADAGCSFVNKYFQLITIDLCCGEYDDPGPSI